MWAIASCRINKKIKIKDIIFLSIACSIYNMHETKVVIVGSGFSGICMGYFLKQNNIHDFVILEKRNAVGGTWHENKYPGAECDVESHLYSFSFYPKSDWSKIFSGSDEIEDYIMSCAKHFDIYKHIVFEQTVTKSTFNDSSHLWSIETESEVYLTNFFIPSCSPLHCPSLPKISHMDCFKGKIMHTAQWDHSFDFSNKKVAVIGNAASGIQCIPHLAECASHLYVFQRTPNWIIPKFNRSFFSIEKWIFRHVPFAQAMYRSALYHYHECFFGIFYKQSWLGSLVRGIALAYMRLTVKDAAVRERLTPKYAFGCKRVLLSDNYFQTFNSPKVQLVSDKITELSHSAIIATDGSDGKNAYEVDAIVCATGFDVFAPLKNMHISNLKESKAFMGIYLQDAPNLFLLLGPNSGSSHNGIPLYVEPQAQHISGMISTLLQTGARRLVVKDEVFRAFNQSIQTRLGRFVWDQCDSWYLQSGTNDTLYPDHVANFVKEAASINLGNFDVL